MSVEASTEIGSVILVDDVDEDQLIGVPEETPGASAFILDDEDDLPSIVSSGRQIKPFDLNVYVDRGAWGDSKSGVQRMFCFGRAFVFFGRSGDDAAV